MNRLTKYEKARVIGLRAEQIANGAKPCIKLDNLNNSPLDYMKIAEEELNQKKCPMFIVRKFVNGDSQEIDVNKFDI